MNLKNLLYIVTLIVFVTFSSEIFLVLSGSKILLEEVQVGPGEFLESDDLIQIFGEENKNSYPVLLCKYFNGRKIVFRTYKYSPINEGGKDACPSFLRPRQ